MVTIKKINKKHARHVIEQSMAALGLEMNMKTDPAIIESLLREMRLDDFKTDFAPMKKFFADALAKPQSLRPMFESIKQGIVNKHPAIVEFAELALSKKWFASSAHIQRAAHVAYVLEAMTAAMCNSHKFFLEAEDYLRAQEVMCGLDHEHLLRSFLSMQRVTHSVFETMKALSLDPAMIIPRTRCGLENARIGKVQLRELSRKEKLNFVERKLLSTAEKNDLEHSLKLVGINLFEAGITEYKKGFQDNAFCAHALNEVIQKTPPAVLFKARHIIPLYSSQSFYETLCTSDNHFPVFGFSQDWMSVYVTWNLAFVLGDLDELDLLIPKLLIPSVLNAKSEHFLGARGIALWLSINNFLFRLRDHAGTVSGPENKQEMANAWGAINKKYATAFMQNETHETRQHFLSEFHHFFSFPVFHFLKLLGDFAIR